MCAVEVGDIFFMKGRTWPGGGRGLIHKSPEPRYHPDGRVVNRLVLKVDVPGPEFPPTWDGSLPLRVGRASHPRLVPVPISRAVDAMGDVAAGARRARVARMTAAAAQ